MNQTLCVHIAQKHKCKFMQVRAEPKYFVGWPSCLSQGVALSGPQRRQGICCEGRSQLLTNPNHATYAPLQPSEDKTAQNAAWAQARPLGQIRSVKAVVNTQIIRDGYQINAIPKCLYIYFKLIVHTFGFKLAVVAPTQSPVSN